MRWPFQIRKKRGRPADWPVNEDAEKLDRFYDKFIGNKGLLREETRWLAVTHRSFDQGKRGFNDRLAYFGMYPVDTEKRDGTNVG